jgi:hypothetical protein
MRMVTLLRARFRRIILVDLDHHAMRLGSRCNFATFLDFGTGRGVVFSAIAVGTTNVVAKASITPRKGGAFIAKILSKNRPLAKQH